MHDAYVSIGSNMDRERNVRSAIDALRVRFGQLLSSPVYDSPAVGFDGPPFLNLSVVFQSDLPVTALVGELHAIERLLGRDDSMAGLMNRTIDLDLILYGDSVLHDDSVDVPRGELLCSAHVLKPLLDLQPDLVHPETGRALIKYWQAMDDTHKQALREVSFA